MHPVLLQIGPVTLHSYGAAIALGFILCVLLGRRVARRDGIDPDRITDVAFWVLLLGFVGCRILYVITRWDAEFARDPVAVLRIWEGGMVFLGGPILVIPFLYGWARRHRIPGWKMLDVGAICLTLAHAFGRIGCLATGCCYGRPTDLPWGIRFDIDRVDAHLRGIPLHPTQVYESAGLFALCAGLVWLSTRKRFDGQVAATYLLVYPVLRALVEHFRGDDIRGFVVGEWLSTSQFISIFLFAAGVVVFLRLRGRRPGEVST